MIKTVLAQTNWNKNTKQHKKQHKTKKKISLSNINLKHIVDDIKNTTIKHKDKITEQQIQTQSQTQTQMQCDSATDCCCNIYVYELISIFEKIENVLNLFPTLPSFIYERLNKFVIQFE